MLCATERTRDSRQQHKADVRACLSSLSAALVRSILSFLTTGGLLTCLAVGRTLGQAALECYTSDLDESMWWPLVAHELQPLARKLEASRNWWHWLKAASNQCHHDLTSTKQGLLRSDNKERSNGDGASGRRDDGSQVCRLELPKHVRVKDVIAVTHNARHAMAILLCFRPKRTKQERAPHECAKMAVMWDASSGTLLQTWCLDKLHFNYGPTQCKIALHFPWLVVDWNSLETECIVLDLSRSMPVIVWQLSSNGDSEPRLVSWKPQVRGQDQQQQPRQWSLVCCPCPLRFRNRSKDTCLTMTSLSSTDGVDGDGPPLVTLQTCQVRPTEWCRFFGRWDLDECRQYVDASARRTADAPADAPDDKRSSLPSLSAQLAAVPGPFGEATQTALKAQADSELAGRRFEFGHRRTVRSIHRRSGSVIVSVEEAQRLRAWRFTDGALLWQWDQPGPRWKQTSHPDEKPMKFASVAPLGILDCVVTARFVTVLTRTHVTTLLLATGQVMLHKYVSGAFHVVRSSHFGSNLCLNGTAGNVVVVCWPPSKYNASWEDVSERRRIQPLLVYRLTGRLPLTQETHDSACAVFPELAVCQVLGKKDDDTDCRASSVPSHLSASHGRVMSAVPLSGQLSWPGPSDWRFELRRFA